MKIVGAAATAVFSLASAFAGTYAWFAANSNVSASNMQITIKAPDEIKFELYYLDYFGVKNESSYKDGNYDTTINQFAGYEVAASNPVFTKIEYDNEGNVLDDSEHDSNPTSINHLWPAHKLTYAIVITNGSLKEFILDSWGENTNPNIKVDADTNVSLSWAINIYGGAYSVSDSGNIINDLATGFSSYNGHVLDGTITDKFGYSENQPAPSVKTPINVVDSVYGSNSEQSHVILYFSIEFSDDEETYYSFENPYYVKDEDGNSNCYEKLSLTSLSFKLV